ncbi:MAG: CHC2 zinc finger domain-containing protein [Candidatus Zixiibacteriota bacterium]|jgi:DNA primase catalytic core
MNNNLKLKIDGIKDRVDIVDIVNERIVLDENHKGICPFHNDKKPSFSVNAQEQYFYCFGCGTGGDVIRFIELFEEKSFWESVTDLAKSVGVYLPAMTPEEGVDLERERMIEDILDKSALFYHSNLSEPVVEYLKTDRGFNDETISRFKIGFASGGLKDCLVKKHGFSEELCVEAGVVKRNHDGTVVDIFLNRIIFPNIWKGRVVYLIGRVFRQGEPKYMNMRRKIKYLYNEDALANAEVVIAEGIPDTITVVQEGYNAVGILGASNFKEEYLNRFSRCRTVYVCLDGDEAGDKGCLKIAELLAEKAKVVELPRGSDLNGYFKTNSKGDFDALLENAKTLIDYLLEQIRPDADKLELCKLIEPILIMLSELDEITSHTYLDRRIKPRFGLTSKEIEVYKKKVNDKRKADAKTPSSRAQQGTLKAKPTALFAGLVDVVEHEGQPKFLVKEGEDLTFLPSIERDGETYVPPPLNQMPWELARGKEVIKQYDEHKCLEVGKLDEGIYDDLFEYHRNISVLPHDGYYHLVVAWVLHTYCLEAFQYSPIINLFAVPERGKTRTGKGMIQAAYRGIHVESLREPFIFRAADNFNASIFFDVMNIWKKAEVNRSEDIILGRFEKGLTIPRVLYPEKGPFKDTVYYSLFGPTVVATNIPAHPILETRALTVNMPAVSVKYNTGVKPENAIPLKEKLLAFRARYLGRPMPDIINPISGRLGDISKPLLQVASLTKPQCAGNLLDLILEIGEEKKREKASTLEGRIIRVILESADQVEWNTLPVKLITDRLNEGVIDNRKLSYPKIGRVLTSLGFRKAKTVVGASAILYEQDLLERLAQEYGAGEIFDSREGELTKSLFGDSLNG